MLLEILNKETSIINYEPEISENIYDISNLIIPFSIIFKKRSPPDIYCGEETIPFEKKDSEFKQILIYEFLLD